MKSLILRFRLEVLIIFYLKVIFNYFIFSRRHPYFLKLYGFNLEKSINLSIFVLLPLG